MSITKAVFKFNGKSYQADFSQPLDLSIPLGKEFPVLAWHCETVKIEPVVMEGFIGDTTQGSPVNFKNIFFNPHGNATHTENVGHILTGDYTMDKTLLNHHFFAKLVTIKPKILDNEDRVIDREIMESLLKTNEAESLIIRTLPNNFKLNVNYTGSNPTYLTANAAHYIRTCGIRHLILDLPSIDREKDDGLMAAHKAFWNVEAEPDKNATITEMAFIKDEIEDGFYLLNLQTAPFINDATPSRPVIYKLKKL
jgi:kynurenine formamidase